MLTNGVRRGVFADHNRLISQDMRLPVADSSAQSCKRVDKAH